MRIGLLIGIAAVAFLIAWNSARSRPPPVFENRSASPRVNPSLIEPLVVPIALADSDEFAYGARAEFHPHGRQVCASGCAASNHPTEKLSKTAFQDFVSTCAADPMDETSEALESLLFYGRQSRQFLKTEDISQLDSQRRAFLQHELARTHVLVSIRVTDESGVTRASLPSTRVPLDRRHEFKLDEFNVQPLMCSGTVKRVGLYHLWTRLWLEGVHFVAGPWFAVHKSGDDWQTLGQVWISNGTEDTRGKIEIRIQLG